MTPSDDRLRAARAALIKSLRREVNDDRVLAALDRVPRERFVAPEQQASAYEDKPLPIGYGQTISQPRMVAIVLQELRLEGTERVLELGTGSGYQAALLAELARQVVSVEIVPELAEQGRRILEELGYGETVAVQLAGEALGWPQEAPYEAIVVAAAAPRIPQSLVDQLAPGGRLLIPVGSRQSQDLFLVQRLWQGFSVTRKGSCRFVPLLGKEAFDRSDLGGQKS